MKKHLSLSQRIHNANASQEVENVKGRHAYLHARVDAVTEYMTIWQILHGPMPLAVCAALMRCGTA